DGYEDGVVYDFDSHTLHMLTNNADNSFTWLAELSLSGGFPSYVIEDFNGDGYTDVIFKSMTTNELTFCAFDLGAPGFFTQTTVPDLTGGLGFLSFDLNNDGLKDIIAVPVTSPGFSVLLNTSITLP